MNIFHNLIRRYDKDLNPYVLVDLNVLKVYLSIYLAVKKISQYYEISLIWIDNFTSLVFVQK